MRYNLQSTKNAQNAKSDKVCETNNLLANNKNNDSAHQLSKLFDFFSHLVRTYVNFA